MNSSPLPPNTARPNYNSGTALRAFLEERGLSVRKQWGQNFLINPRARTALVDALDAGPGAAVWEIGSGPGCMTGELLDRGLSLTAFEIDPGLCSVLQELFAASGRFTLVRGDVLKTWKSAVKADYLLGNLPYTVAAILMGNLIENGCFFSRMVITVQKEVALRMAAAPGSKDYSSISVLCASAYSMKIIMTLKGQSFYPVPHVDSAAVRFERLPNAPVPPPLFYPLLRALFAARRKTIANNLQNFLGRSCTIKNRETGGSAAAAESLALADIAAEVFRECGLSPKDRAENLSCGDFLSLANKLEQYVDLSGNGKRA
jgi:16S rRNA (adenine1518-N6/adenine1519-N6)-dimethyltransferase